MRDDEHYTRTQTPYADDGYAPYADEQGYAYQQGYGEQQPAGFTRHRSSNARRVAEQNPVTGAARRIGQAVSGAFAKKTPAPAAAGARPARSSRASSFQEGGDYLGVGEPCRVCGNPVDARQGRCPHCGAFVRPLYTNPIFIAAVVVLIAAVVGLSLAINACKPGSEPSQPVDLSGQTAVGQDRSALTAATTSAQATIDAQATARTYTRQSLNNLQNAVWSAQAVLADGSSSDDLVAQAAQAVGSAMAALTPISSDYPWPAYSDIVANPAAFEGQQVVVNGTAQYLNYHEEGYTTVVLAIAGDTSQLIYIDYYLSDIGSDPVIGGDYNAYGTFVGLAADGVPYILADAIEGV